MRILIFCLLFVSTIGYAQKLKPFSYYQANSKITPTAKTIYKNLNLYKKDMSKFWPFYEKNEVKIMAMIDSVNTTNNDTRPFYNYILGRILPFGDGGFGESMSIAVSRYIVNHPSYFFGYMIDNPGEQKLLTDWSEYYQSGLRMKDPEFCRKEKQRLIDEHDKFGKPMQEEDPDLCLKMAYTHIMEALEGEKKEIKKLANSFLGHAEPTNRVNKEITIFIAGQLEQSVTVKNGEQFVIKFPQKASGTGYSWEMIKKPTNAILMKTEYIDVEHVKGTTGFGQYALLTFQATKIGDEDINFVYAQNWNLKETGKEKLVLHLKVK